MQILTDLSTSSVRCSHFILGNPKNSFSTVLYSYILLIFTSSQKKTNCNPLAHLSWKCHHTNLGNGKCWRLWRQPVVGWHRWLWKEPVVMCGNWNVRQAMSQQVFRVTTFCISTCFKCFSTLISCLVHHAVLKFSPCRNKPLPQASTCPYQQMHSSCSVPQTQYWGYAHNRKH